MDPGCEHRVLNKNKTKAKAKEYIFKKSSKSLETVKMLIKTILRFQFTPDIKVKPRKNSDGNWGKGNSPSLMVG